MPWVRMLCMANSTKLGGRCVAGIDLESHRWIRLVSDDDNGTLYPRHYSLVGGGEPRLLDVIRVNVLQGLPKLYQPENYLTGPGRWELVERPGDPAETIPALATCRTLGPMVFNDASDRIPVERFEHEPSSESLTLVAPKELLWQVSYSGSGGKTKVRATFRLLDEFYSLRVTDPLAVNRLSRLGEGRHEGTEIGVEQGGAFSL